MKKGLISVIVPVYKVEEYLDRCVESIVNQTYKNLEIILVDDGSPDNCPKMCDEWAKKDKRIKVIHKKNGGVSSARNTGLDNANGEYVGFVDSDDYISKRMYEYLINGMNKNIDMTCCNYTNDLLLFEKINNEKKLFDSINMINNIFPWNGSSCLNLYKKCVIDEFNLNFNTTYKYGEDLLFVLDYCSYCSKICYFNAFLYYYYDNSSSATNSNVNIDEQYFLAISEGFKILKNRNCLNNFTTQSYLYYLFNLYNKNISLKCKLNVIKELSYLIKNMNIKQKLKYYFIILNYNLLR